MHDSFLLSYSYTNLSYRKQQIYGPPFLFTKRGTCSRATLINGYRPSFFSGREFSCVASVSHRFRYGSRYKCVVGSNCRASIEPDDGPLVGIGLQLMTCGDHSLQSLGADCWGKGTMTGG
ncbi:hypothetical protein AVEN_64153-1 [Araneus ventricosus]|uniref:Uncharacterized protein n=1 Tax=Araneus ventricosus TaxID=182803 RepID=A0A4Y2C487_ARAVE|nr:hypothetical protein AVEN_64153-1 [Araneus ventricosus]